MSATLTETEENSYVSSMVDLKRIAIDSSGRLGSFYDARRDYIVGNLIKTDENEVNISGAETNIHQNDNDEQLRDLLRELEMDEQLRLSTLLELIPNEGISSTINYPYKINKQTRLFHYSLSIRKQHLSENIDDVKSSIRTLETLPNATHLITGIGWGFDMVLVLQLPSNLDEAQEINKAVMKFLECLNDDNFDSTITSEEAILLKNITHFKVYTNVPNQEEFATMYDIRRFVKENTSKFTDYPISYTIRPIECLLPEISNKMIKFTPIPRELNDQIEDYVRELLADMKLLDTYINKNQTNFSEEEEEQLKNIKEQLNGKYKQLSNVVIELRSGQNKIEVAKRILNDNDESVTVCPNTGDEVVREAQQNEENQSESCPSPTPSSETTIENETINILVLGATGVGKSTFINAFANYLKFDSLEKAKNSQPVALIPVSFLITTGDNFEERIVKFGNADDLNNEDFQHPGQSVTQQCKTYEFSLKQPVGQKLCFIDTPGFGDTRGLDRDDYNMAHILEYIQKFSHLNAICLLLKPNEARLHLFYRSWLLQLCSVLKTSCFDKIIFCFTNSRSTFYTPGDTAPLLRKMLATVPVIDKLFKKENVFCLDSESFRYLVSLHDGINFNDLQEGEYAMSWTKSVKESQRLIQYLCQKLSNNLIDKN